jgi:hypothetical protein
MKTVPSCLLQFAHNLGLVRGVRMVRTRTDHGMAWTVALRILGRWWLAARPRVGRFAGPPDTTGAMNGPLVLASIGEARRFLDDVGM